MRIKTRMYTVFGIMLIAVILLLSLSIQRMQVMKRSLDDIVNVQYKKLETATRVQMDMNNIAKALRNYLLANSDDFRRAQLDTIESSRKDAEAALGALNQLTDSEQGKIIIKQIATVGTEYFKFQEGVIKTSQAGQGAEAARMVSEDGQALQKQLFAQIDDLVALNKFEVGRQLQDTYNDYRRAIASQIVLSFLLLMAAVIFMLWLTRRISTGLGNVSSFLGRFTKGELDVSARLSDDSTDEIGTVSRAFNDMLQSLDTHLRQERELAARNEEQLWLQERMSKLNQVLLEASDLESAARQALTKILSNIQAPYGSIYGSVETEYGSRLERLCGYALGQEEAIQDGRSIQFGEGLIGQCAVEKRTIELSPPVGALRIVTDTIDAEPVQVRFVPLLVGQSVEGVLELATLQDMPLIQQQYIDQAATLLAIIMNKIKSKLKIERLLEETRTASEELIQQQEELAQMNEELEEQIDNSQEQNQALERTMEELELKTQELSEAVRYKSAFLANMSHELRTPLNSMLVLTKLMTENKDGNLTPKQLEYVTTVYSSGKDLLALINDILDLAKIESQKIEAVRERVDMSEIVEFVKGHFTAIASQKSLDFRVDVDLSAPKSFYCDQRRMQQIISNLLSNAFKFTHEGGVQLSITTLEEDRFPPGASADRVRLAFHVKDTGIGLEPDKQEVIFDAFVQADDSTSRRYGGTGLGLSISRQLAELLGGEIRLSSEAGKGSIFTLILPVEVAESGVVEVETERGGVWQPEPLAAPVVSPKKGLNLETILLVDDDVRNVFALSSALESFGYRIVYAENGKQALEALEKHPEINAVLMDIMMPEMDGYEAMTRIRQIPRYKNLPVLAVTAKAMRDDREKCIQAGASDYITKPIDIEQLHSLLKVWLYA